MAWALLLWVYLEWLKSCWVSLWPSSPISSVRNALELICFDRHECQSISDDSICSRRKTGLWKELMRWSYSLPLSAFISILSQEFRVLDLCLSSSIRAISLQCFNWINESITYAHWNVVHDHKIHKMQFYQILLSVVGHRKRSMFPVLRSNLFLSLVTISGALLSVTNPCCAVRV